MSAKKERTWTEEEVNNIINLVGHDGRQIDIFDLHGVLFLGNGEGGEWDLSKRYTRFNEHSVPISIEDFQGCEDEDHINEQFFESLREAINEKLL